jgi:hypothetical protein
VPPTPSRARKQYNTFIRQEGARDREDEEEGAEEGGHGVTGVCTHRVSWTARALAVAAVEAGPLGAAVVVVLVEVGLAGALPGGDGAQGDEAEQRAGEGEEEGPAVFVVHGFILMEVCKKEITYLHIFQALGTALTFGGGVKPELSGLLGARDAARTGLATAEAHLARALEPGAAVDEPELRARLEARNAARWRWQRAQIELDGYLAAFLITVRETQALGHHFEPPARPEGLPAAIERYLAKPRARVLTEEAWGRG